MAFECKEYYDSNGNPGADKPPTNPKRGIIPVKNMWRNIADVTAHSERLSLRDDDEQDGDDGSSNPVIAMTPGEDTLKKPSLRPQTTDQKKQVADGFSHVCSEEFLEFTGLKPPPKPKPHSNLDDEEELPYEDWAPDAELPDPWDYKDLQLPPGWDQKPSNQNPYKTPRIKE